MDSLQTRVFIGFDMPRNQKFERVSRLGECCTQSVSGYDSKKGTGEAERYAASGDAMKNRVRTDKIRVWNENQDTFISYRWFNLRSIILVGFFISGSSILLMMAIGGEFVFSLSGDLTVPMPGVFRGFILLASGIVVLTTAYLFIAVFLNHGLIRISPDTIDVSNSPLPVWPRVSVRIENISFLKSDARGHFLDVQLRNGESTAIQFGFSPGSNDTESVLEALKSALDARGLTPENEFDFKRRTELSDEELDIELRQALRKFILIVLPIVILVLAILFVFFVLSIEPTN